jgi:hypothetical protein
LEGLNREKSALIFDFKSKKIIREIKSIGTSLNFELQESPWVYNEKQFVYAISSDKKIFVDTTRITPVHRDKDGIYLFDVNTNQKTFLIPEGRFAVCSPVDLRIGYIKDQSIWIMNLKDSSTEKVLEVNTEDKIVNIHWTPDGNCIYIAYYSYDAGNRRKRIEKLIHIKRKKEIQFKKIGHGFHLYTWK